MKPRILLCLLAAAALLLGGALFLRLHRPAAVQEPLPDTTIFFATDLHYLAPELTDHGSFFTQFIADADGKVMAYSDELLEAFTAQVIARKPDALVLSGDLTFNGEKRSHERLAEKLARIRAAGIAVFVLPGNHDLENPSAVQFAGDGYTPAESVTGAEFADIYAACGYSGALARDPASLSYVAALSDRLRLLMVDVNDSAVPGFLAPQTLSWIQSQLEQAEKDGARVIPVSHQNLLQHNALFASGFQITGAEDLLPVYLAAGVTVNFSGHLHLQHIAQSGALTEIVTSALAVTPNQYGVLTLSGQTGDYRTEPVDVAAWARAQGSGNADLLDFSAYSAAFFRDSSYRKALGRLPQGSEALARFFAEANTLYFTGFPGRIDWAAAPAYSAGEPFAGYLDSIRADTGAGYNRCTLSFAPAG